MNQQQRRYMVKELSEIRYNKIRVINNEASDDTYIDYNNIIESVVKDIKADKYTFKSNTLKLDSISDYTKGEYLTKMVKRGYAKVNGSGYFAMDRDDLWGALREMSSKMFCISPNSYSPMNRFRNIMNILNSIVEGDAIKGLIKDSQNSRDARVKAVESEHKSVERSIMLADSDELMVALKEFEEMVF